MSNTRIFLGVTAKLLLRMQEMGHAEYGIVYDTRDGHAGTATSHTPLGECVIEFVHHRERSELALALVKKPPLLPEELLWSGFADTLERCREPSPRRNDSNSAGRPAIPVADRSAS